MGAGTAPTSVEVPDVVGETQSAGTTELQAVLFVVSVVTAYSSSISAGLIISQDPVGGTFALEGSTVTISVSLGPNEQPTGGWLFHNAYHAELHRRRARDRKRREIEEETEQIQNELDRAIAQELRKQERLDDKRKDYERLAELAKANADLEAARLYSERVATAYARALTKGTYSALEALDREMQRANEEEEFLATAVLMLIH
jgi:PASTA domain-containing protein